MKYFAIALSLLFVACSNKYEEQIIGTYIVTGHARYPNLYNNHFSLIQKDSTRLILKSDKTFHLIGNRINISGTWKAFDTGDWTEIDFSVGEKTFEATLTGENLELIQFQYWSALCCKEYRIVSLRKIKR
jgi:hypothetical protein